MRTPSRFPGWLRTGRYRELRVGGDVPDVRSGNVAGPGSCAGVVCFSGQWLGTMLSVNDADIVLVLDVSVGGQDGYVVVVTCCVYVAISDRFGQNKPVPGVVPVRNPLAVAGDFRPIQDTDQPCIHWRSGVGFPHNVLSGSLECRQVLPRRVLDEGLPDFQVGKGRQDVRIRRIRVVQQGAASRRDIPSPCHIEYDGVGVYDTDHRLYRVAVQVRFRDVEVLQDASQADEAARRRGEIDSILVEEFHGGDSRHSVLRAIHDFVYGLFDAGITRHHRTEGSTAAETKICSSRCPARLATPGTISAMPWWWSEVSSRRPTIPLMPTTSRSGSESRSPTSSSNSTGSVVAASIRPG